MSLKDTVAAWWSAWKWVAILVLLLAFSAWLNVWQYGRHAAAKAEGNAAAYAQIASTNADIAKQAQQDSAGLITQLQAIADRGKQVKVIYRAAAAQAPLPDQCAPGQGRIDAVNKALGPQKE